MGAKVLISHVLQALRTSAVLIDDEIPVFNVLLSGQAVCQVFVPESDRSVFAKITAPHGLANAQDLLELNLDTEYQALTQAGALLPGRVPETITLYEYEGWQVLVTEAIEHVRVTPWELEQPAASVRDDLIVFLEAMSSGLRNASCTTTPHQLYLEELCAEFADYPCVQARASWLRGPGTQVLAALPQVPQHCDFVAMNFGRDDEGLVFFDWEDFGKVSLPGLDLATLVFSSLDNDIEKMVAFVAEPGSVGIYPVVSAGCRLYDLSEQDFLHLMPFYVAAFLRLKRSRHPAIQQVLSSLLHALP